MVLKKSLFHEISKILAHAVVLNSIAHSIQHKGVISFKRQIFCGKKLRKSSLSTKFHVPDNRLVSARKLVASGHASNIYLGCMQMSTSSQTRQKHKHSVRAEASVSSAFKKANGAIPGMGRESRRYEGMKKKISNDS